MSSATVRLLAAFLAFAAGAAALVIVDPPAAERARMSWRRSCCLRPLAALALALAVPAALADGDPASDYLLSRSTFLSPFDGHIPAAEQAAINAMLASAKEKGFPLRVALIVTPYDLGSVPILFDKPKTYAKFLGEEDFYYWKDELLVVMPNGYGIYKASDLPAADKAVARGAAEARLREAARRSGSPPRRRCARSPPSTASRSSASGAASGGSSTWTDRAEIAGGALVLCLLGFAGWALWRRRRHA